MRKTLILLIFSISVFQSSGQKDEKALKSKIYYQQNSERQKTAGWVLLVGGSLLTIIGLSTATSEGDNVVETIGSPFLGGFVAVIGAGTAIGGISLLKSSRKNARKAAQISFNNQRFILPKNNTLAVKMQPTVTLRISLGNYYGKK